MTTRDNPYYQQYNKIIKLEGPHKSMLVGQWNESVTNLLWTTEPTLTARGMLNFYPHCDNQLFGRLYPNAAIAGAPANITLVPVPLQAPPVPFDAPIDAYKLQKMQNERFERYTAALNTIWHEVMASFDDSIYSEFKTLAGTNNILTIDLVQINTYINGPAFSNKSEANIKHYLDKIEAPLNYEQTLNQNFASVEHAWRLLQREAPTRAPTDNALFALMKSKLESNPRLLDSIESYVKSPGVNDLNATFTNLKTFVLTDYPTCFQDRSTIRFAFLDDKDYDPTLNLNNRNFHPLGAAAEVSIPNEAIALAARVDEKSEEWLAFQEWRKIQEAKKSKTPVEGKLCFFHGWNKSHDSSQCTRMKKDPKFTAAQKSFVKIPRSKNVVIDGVQCNLNCAEGVVPAK